MKKALDVTAVEYVRTIGYKSSTSETVLIALSIKERFKSKFNILRFKTELRQNNEKIVDEDFNQFWKDLEAGGYAKVKYGRNGNPKYCEAYCNLRTISSEITGLSYKDNSKIKTEKPLKEKSVIRSERLLFVHLKSGKNLEIKMTGTMVDADLVTVTEALNSMIH